MKEFSPEEQVELNLERAVNDMELKRGGAKYKSDGRLEVTHEQLKEAAVEMRLLKSQKKERVVTKGVNEHYEIEETRVFSIDEIIAIISRFEILDPNDFYVLEYTVDKNGDIIDAVIKLREEIAYDKFGCGTNYIYQIKGVTKQEIGEYSENQTTIKKFFDPSDSEEFRIREDVNIDYAKDENERDEAEEVVMKSNDGSHSEDFITFDGVVWEEDGG